MHHRFTCILTLTLLGLLAGASASVASDPARTPAQTERLFKANWSAFRHQFIQVHGEYLAAPRYDIRYPNAARTTADAYRKDHTQVVEFDLPTSWLNGSRVAPSRDEADVATRVLTGAAPGDYGHIRSATIEAVLDEQTVVLTNIELVDAAAIQRARDADEKAMLAYLQEKWDDQHKENVKRWRNHEARLIGPGRRATRKQAEELLAWRFQTRDRALALQQSLAKQAVLLTGLTTTRTLRPGAKFTGVGAAGQQLYMLGTATRPTADGGSERALLAVDGAALRRGLNEAAFRAMLEQADISIDRFVDAAVAARRADPTDFRTAALTELGLNRHGTVAPPEREPERVADTPAAKQDAAEAGELTDAERQALIDRLRGMTRGQRRAAMKELSREQRRAVWDEMKKRRQGDGSERRGGGKGNGGGEGGGGGEPSF